MFAYDAIWAVALTLNKSIETLQAQGKSLEQFNYEDSSMSSVFQEKLQALHYRGMSVSSATKVLVLAILFQCFLELVLCLLHLKARPHSATLLTILQAISVAELGSFSTSTT